MEKVERLLKCNLEPEELLLISESLGKNLQEMEDLEREKKSMASDIKFRGDALDALISHAGRCLREKSEERPVECVWYWNTPKRNRKQLVRTDTYEVVEETDMSDRDHQKAADANQTRMQFDEAEEVPHESEETLALPSSIEEIEAEEVE